MGKKRQRNHRLTKLQKTFLAAFVAIMVVLLISVAAILIANRAYVTGKNHIYVLEKQEKLDKLTESLEQEIQIAEQQLLKLLSSSQIRQIAYSRSDMEPYSYYSQTLAIINRMKEIADDFQIVQNVYLTFETTALSLNQEGLLQHFPLSQEELAQASQEGMFAKGGQLYIVRTLMDYQAPEPSGLCTIVMELNTKKLYERCSFLCQGSESVALLIHDQVLEGVGQSETSDQQVITSSMEFYSLQVSLSIGTARYQLSTDEWLASVGAVVGITCLLAWAFILYYYLHLYRPLELLLDEAFSHMKQGDLAYRISTRNSGSFANIYQTFNESMAQLEYLMDHVYRQKLLISEMQFKQLQSQINPHFMYNTYYTLYRLIQDRNWASSSQLARLLGDFYQYITRNGSTERTLREELRHTLTYVEIQTIRFPDTIQEIEPLPEEIAQLLVPQLILQPVFENVFQHARQNLQPEEPLHLRLRYEMSQDGVCISVENNGALRESTIDQLRQAFAQVDRQQETTALINIHRRLRFFYGEEAGLTVSRSDLNGLCVCIHLKGEGHGTAGRPSGLPD